MADTKDVQFVEKDRYYSVNELYGIAAEFISAYINTSIKIPLASLGCVFSGSTLYSVN
jgi:hypothetical protein